MPVRFGEISTNHEAFLTESIKQVLGDICIFTVLVWSFCDAIIRIFGIVHTEAVMMLGSKDEVFASGFFRNIRPTGRLKLDRIE